MSIDDFLATTQQKLKTVGIQSARLDAEILLCYTLDKPRSWILAHLDYCLDHEQLARLDSLVKKRTSFVPIAYLTGVKEFYGRIFYVDKRVLIPRPESESLIDLALGLTRNETINVLDIGCGSGILGITLALEKPNWKIVMSDVSSDALEVASKNLKKHNLSDSVKSLHSPFIPSMSEKTDLIITNLPYVPNNLKNKIDIKSEPSVALFADSKGLATYESLFLQIGLLGAKKPKYIITESLSTQHEDINRFAEKSGYKLKKTHDLGQLFVFDE